MGGAVRGRQRVHLGRRLRLHSHHLEDQLAALMEGDFLRRVQAGIQIGIDADGRGQVVHAARRSGRSRGSGPVPRGIFGRRVGTNGWWAASACSADCCCALAAGAEGLSV